MSRDKSHKEIKEKVDKEKSYTVNEAVDLLEQTKSAKFDETVDIAVKLGIDPRHADQQIRTAMVLPHGTGKDVRVLVFAKDDKVKEALDAGADYAGLEEYVDKISNENWLEFEVAIATPDVMSVVGKLGKVLGPRGLMPSPKINTVTFDVGKVVKESKTGRIQVRNDKGGVVHAPAGKVSFGKEKLKDNILAFIDSLIKMKPSSSKGIYLRKVTVSNTMGPGINIDINNLREELKEYETAA